MLRACGLWSTPTPPRALHSLRPSQWGSSNAWRQAVLTSMVWMCKHYMYPYLSRSRSTVLTVLVPAFTLLPRIAILRPRNHFVSVEPTTSWDLSLPAVQDGFCNRTDTKRGPDGCLVKGSAPAELRAGRRIDVADLIMSEGTRADRAACFYWVRPFNIPHMTAAWLQWQMAVLLNCLSTESTAI